MKKYFKIILSILLCTIIIILPNIVFANSIDTSQYTDIYSKNGTSTVNKAGGKILGVVQVIGVSVGIIFLIILGVKYMASSTNDKATIKERLIPYAIGAVLMFGGTGLLTIIANFARNMG